MATPEAAAERSRKAIFALHVVSGLGQLNGAIVGSMFVGYMQSKISCDTPVPEGEFTGSAYCGDQQYIISQSTRRLAIVFSFGQVVDILKMILRGNIIDRFNRRMLAVSCVGIDFVEKLLLMLIHDLFGCGFLWEVSFLVLTSAARLKPDFAFEYLWLDITEGMSDMDRMQAMVGVQNTSRMGNFAGTLLALLFISMQPTEYRWIFILLVTMASIAVAFISSIPEGQHAQPPQSGSSNWFRETWEDCREYLFSPRHRLFQGHIIKEIIGTFSAAAGKNFGPLAMMVHGMQARGNVAANFLMGFVAMPLPMIGLSLAKRFGVCRFVYAMQTLPNILVILMAYLVPVTANTFYGWMVVNSVPAGLTDNLVMVACQHMPHNKAEIRGRTSTLQGLIIMAVDAIATPIAAWALQGSLVPGGSVWTYWRISFWFSFFRILSLAIYILNYWPFIDRQLALAEKDFHGAPGNNAGDAKEGEGNAGRANGHNKAE